jgi:WD40 repeat protein
MQILDISAQISKIIKTTDIEMISNPYYLDKRNLFICDTLIPGVGGWRIIVFNLQGEILVTLQDHRIYVNSFHLGSYITTAQDIVISVFYKSYFFGINISSILTGKCIAKITAGTSNRSNIRESALRFLRPESLAYDETTNKIFTASEDGEIFIWSNKLYSDVRMGNLYGPIDTSSSSSEEEVNTDEEDEEMNTDEEYSERDEEA